MRKIQCNHCDRQVKYEIKYSSGLSDYACSIEHAGSAINLALFVNSMEKMKFEVIRLDESPMTILKLGFREIEDDFWRLRDLLIEKQVCDRTSLENESCDLIQKLSIWIVNNKIHV